MALRLLALLALFAIGLSGEEHENAAQGGAGVVPEEEGVQWLRSGQSARRRMSSYSSRPSPRPSPTVYDSRRRAPAPAPYDSRRRAPAPAPTPPAVYDSRRRGVPTPSPSPTYDSRRRGVPTPSPTPTYDSRRRVAVDPGVRRRTTNEGRFDDSRRRADIRRRSSSGWNTVDYSRRRGASVGAAAGLGFAGGLVMGSLITRPGGEQYYFHQHDWVDMYGVRHLSGYYSPDGYRYASGSDFGYMPPRGAPYPDSYNNHRNNGFSFFIWSFILVLCLFAIVATKSKRSPSSSEYVDDDYERLRSQQSANQPNSEPVTREGQTIPRANAVAFIRALEAEYVDGVEEAVGNMLGNVDGEVAERLGCEENAVRDSAEGPQRAISSLASRWNMRDVLNHS